MICPCPGWLNMNVTMNDVKFGFRKIIKNSIANFAFYNRLEQEKQRPEFK